MNRVRLQHYVPQFLLQRFTDRSGALAVYDKKNGRSFSTGPRAVAAESFYYDLDIDERSVLTLESGLAEVEGQSAQIIDHIHRDESLAGLSPDDRGMLAYFVAIQSLRTQHQRANLRHLSRLLIERVNSVVPPDRPEAKLPVPTEDYAKRMSMALILDGAKDIALILVDKPWILARAPDEDLYIGDNPVAMHNERDFGFYGNIGFAVPGVEIHMPLSSRFTLFIPCKSWEAHTRKVTADLDLLRRLDPRAWEELQAHVQPFRTLIKAIDEGVPLDLRPENVERENSLQVGYAGRWVFSRTGDFELVERMIVDDPRHRAGPFGTVS